MHAFHYALCLVLFPLSLLAASPNEAEIQSMLRSVNSWSPVESAASHGMSGFRVGAGVTSFALPAGSQTVFKQETERAGSERIFFPKLLVTKGLWYPLDAGLVYGRLQNSTISQYGGYLQWTLYEALAQPALAIRGMYSRITGLRAGAMESGGASVIASWGIPFVTGFVYYGTSKNRGYIPAADSTSTPAEKTWWQPEAGAGLNLTLLPPFVVFGLEMASSFNTGNGQMVQAKLSFGI
jgi:hypothetical protein